MKILFIIPTTKMDGSIISFLTLIKGLVAKGTQVAIVVPKSKQDDDFIHTIGELNIKCYRTTVRILAYPQKLKGRQFVYELLSRIFYNYLALIQILRVIKKEKPDIVHTNVGPVQCGYYAARIARIPHVWHIREYGDLDFGMKAFPSKSSFIKKLKKSFPICISKDLLSYNCLKDDANASVVYNGVHSKFDVRSFYPKEKYFLTSSRISSEKGFEQIIRVFARFVRERNDFSLKILGKGDPAYVNKTKAMCQRLNIMEKVLFVGYTNEVFQYMEKATALLVASKSEGFGRMTAEAAFAGCLVIGKNTAGTKEVMDITGGFRFMNDEEMLLAMKDVSYLSENEYRIRVSRAQHQAVAFFSNEEYINNILDVYDKILKK